MLTPHLCRHIHKKSTQVNTSQRKSTQVNASQRKSTKSTSANESQQPLGENKTATQSSGASTCKQWFNDQWCQWKYLYGHGRLLKLKPSRRRYRMSFLLPASPCSLSPHPLSLPLPLPLPDLLPPLSNPIMQVLVM